MNAVAKSYWRSIQRGTRTFGAVPDSMKDAVRELAREDVKAGVLDQESYREFIGEDYPEETA